MARERSAGGIRILLSLGIAAVAAIALVLLVVNIMRDYEAQIAEASAPAETVTAIVAMHDLYQGVTITEDDLYAVAVPIDMLADTVYRSPEHVVGRIPRERILGDEFVREERLADADEGIGLNAIIPRGQRAISININDGNALSGHLAPGNYVDLLVTIRDADDRDSRYTRTLLQAVYVLAVNNRKGTGNYDEEDPEAEREAARRYRPSVTLAVTPDQAQEVAHGDQGEITLTLRSMQDIGWEETDGVTTRDITGEEEARPVVRPRPQAAPEPRGTTLQIIRGTVVNEVEIEDGQIVVP
jgi:pilus assembly protein CpaB